MVKKHSHCSYCGNKFEKPEWPRTCVSCNNISYVNPLPVVALVVPVLYEEHATGVLTVRRKQNPESGKLALCGGYMELGETWQEAGARELKEETGIIVDPDKIVLLDVGTSLASGSVLIFGEVIRPINITRLSSFKPNEEVLELVVLKEFEELAFSTHTNAVKTYLGMR